MSEPIWQPAPGLTAAETHTSLVWFNWNITLRGVFETICGGTTMVFVAFAIAVGVPENAMGYFSAAISGACIMQLLFLPLGSRVRQRKRFILTLALLEPPLLAAAILAVPHLPPTWRPLCLGVAVFLAAACLHLTRPFADDWLATTIPSGLRGRYIGQRVRLTSFAIVASTLAVGSAVELLGPANVAGLTLLLLVGAVFGILAVLTLTRVAMPAKTVPQAFTLRDLTTVGRTKPFVRLVVGTLIYMMPFYFAGAYYQVFNLEIVQMSPWLISCMGVGYLVVKLLVTPAFGRLCDRWGPRRLVWAIGPVYVAFFACFPFAIPGRPWPIIMSWAFVALADGVLSVAGPAALYGVIPDQGARPAFFAVYNLLNLFGFGVAGVLAVPLLRLLQGVDWTWGAANLGGYHLFYALLGVLMIPCSFAAGLFPDGHARSPRQASIAKPNR
ncbi:MAG: MFS transporter [Opitutales bacterium]